MTPKWAPAALLLVCIGAACAARIHTSELVTKELSEGGWSLGDFTSGRIHEWLMKHRSKSSGKENQREEDYAYFATRFIVPPEMADDFENAWMKYEDKASDEKGNEIIDLKKTKDDNLIYISYSEWSSMEDWLDHLEEDYSKDFHDFLDDNEIYMMVFPLDNRGDHEMSRHHKGKVQKGKTSKNLHHVMARYFVPPHKVEEFEDAWMDEAKDTWDEDGNHIYALRKVFTDNTMYFVYGTWEDADAYYDHMQSDHHMKLMEFNDDNGIIWFRSSLKKIGKEPE